MDDFPGEEEQISMHGDEMVTFAGIFTRLPTDEEYELVLRFHANQIANDTARLYNLPEAERKQMVEKLMVEDRLMHTATSSVTELPHLGIRLFIMHSFSISHTVNKTNHSFDVSTYRCVIRENNEIEDFPREADYFDL